MSAHIHRTQLPQLLDTRLDHLLNLTELCDVGYRYTGFPAHALDLFGDFLASLFVGRYIIDTNVVAVFGKAESDGFADATGRTSHNCCLAVLLISRQSSFET